MKPLLWGVSVITLCCGVMAFLWPKRLTQLNHALSRNLAVLDSHVMRVRYVFGLLLMVAGYLLFVLGLV